MTLPTLVKPSLRRLDVLLIEDNPAEAERILHELKKPGWEVRAEVVQTAHEFAARLSSQAYHVVLADYHLPGWSGLEALELLQQMDKDIPFLLVSGTVPDETAGEWLRKGVADYVPAECLARLPVAVQRALELRHLREEHARAEQHWRAAEKRYQRLAELSPDPLLIFSEGRVVFANAAAVKLLGAEGAEPVKGKTMLEWIHPDSRAAIEAQFEALGAGMESALFDAKLLRSDGKPVEVKAAAAALMYRDRPAVQFIARDVTERKRVEEAIKSLASFAQLNPNPVLEFSREGKLTYFNDAARELARALGQEHPGAVLPPHAAQTAQLCLTSGQKKSRETTSGGRTLSWNFYPIQQNQVVHCYVCDITERLTLEAQLRHSQRLESVGRLAAGVTHDFNNVLTVIQGHVGLLRSEANLSQQTQESLQQVARAAERAGHLTHQLLTFSRRSAMQPQRLELNELLSNLSAMLHRTLGEDINYQFQYAPELPPVLADAGMLEQVIMNLAVNARDAMPKGGQLTLGTAVADINAAYVERHPAARPGRFVCLTMTDTGCGMDHVTLGRIFEPFFTTKEFGKGTGLGLAVVYGMVQQHQGWIDVQSQLGQGTTFKVFLPPASAAMDRSPEHPAEHPVPGGKETILVVEDEAPVRSIMKNMLERRGYRVLEAGNGIEALAVWHQQHDEVALLLTDMVMPVGLNGQELAEKFKAQKPHLKVIFTSGYSVESAGKGLAEMPGIQFLEKPFDAAKLGQAVRLGLDG